MTTAGDGAQILAGEEIENQFGARLGLSTLAAAGLGNLLSDICGLGLADQIEARAPPGPSAREWPGLGWGCGVLAGQGAGTCAARACVAC